MSRKTLLIGLDGGTFTVLEPLAAEGVIPNLARLMRDGARGILRSTVPPISAPAWATFQTGKNPGKHGLFNFFDLSEGGYRQSHDFRRSRVVNHANIGSATIYDYLKEGGRKVISVNIPLTYPTPEVDGALVACWLTPPGSTEYTWPRSLAAELPDYRIDQNFGEGMYALTPKGRELDSDYLFDDLTEILKGRAEATRHLMQTQDWDLCMVCFTETDRIHHYFWRAINPAYPGYATEKVAHERERFKTLYRELDDRIGALIQAAGPDANVWVISDHGFDAPPARRYNITHWMLEQGWLVTRPKPAAPSGTPGAGAEGPEGPSRKPSAAVAAGKALWKRLVPPSLRDQVYATLGYQPTPQVVDWDRTRAWSFGVNNNLGAICINERDGQGHGCVEPGPEVDALVAAIEKGLTGLTNPETGLPVIRQVMRREAIYDGPYTERFPHLLFLLDPAYEADYESGFGIASRRIETENIYPTGRGNHRPEGISIALGPDFVPGPKEPADLASVMPTLLHLAGLPVPDDVDGPVVTEYLRPELAPVQTRPPAAYTPGRSEPSAEDVERLQEKLRELGYM